MSIIYNLKYFISNYNQLQFLLLYLIALNYDFLSSDFFVLCLKFLEFSLYIFLLYYSLNYIRTPQLIYQYSQYELADQ